VRHLIELFLGIPAGLALPVVFALSALETALFVGLAVPGEVAVILGGVLASRGHVPLWGVLAAGTIGPLVGDSAGFFFGRRHDPKKLKGRAKERWDRAHDWLSKKGGPAVFFGRFAAFLRSIIPAAAGAAGMPYGKFLLWEAPAAILWGVGSVLLGYYAGANYRRILHFAGIIAIGICVIIATLVFLKLRRRRKG
jgi:undecaprenyl-diphosphatase